MFAVHVKASDHIMAMLIEVLVQECKASCIRIPFPADFIYNGADRLLWEATIAAICSAHPGNIAFYGGLPPYDTEFLSRLGIPRIVVSDSLVVSVYYGASDTPAYLDQTLGSVSYKLRGALECVNRRAKESRQAKAA